MRVVCVRHEPRFKYIDGKIFTLGQLWTGAFTVSLRFYRDIPGHGIIDISIYDSVGKTYVKYHKTQYADDYSKKYVASITFEELMRLHFRRAQDVEFGRYCDI